MTYQEYVEGYTGREAIPEKDFEFFFEKAKAMLSAFTFGRSADAEIEEVEYAALEIAQYLFENGGRDGIAGESNDGFSVSYTDGYNLGSAVYSIAKAWLGGTGLMYAGVEQCVDY